MIISFEGCDKSGKTTQIKLLGSWLELVNIKFKSLQFPDRTTDIGKILDSYLKRKTVINPKTAHLLFSANRWEKFEILNSKEIILCDRYTLSGLVYSLANGLDEEWCKKSDEGLPEPVMIFYLNYTNPYFIDANHEFYELLSFQNKVKLEYDKHLSKCHVINCDEKSEQIIHQEIVGILEFYLKYEL
jgi:dTMP kinase